MSTKAIGIGLAAILGLLLFAGGLLYNKYRIAPVLAITDLEALDAKGAPTRVWSQNGRGAVVVFYASWCHDCAREMPKLAQALRGYLRGVDAIALTDEDITAMVRYQYRTAHPFRFYALPADFGAYGIHAIPTTYIVNANGETIYAKVGDVDWTSPEIASAVKQAGL
ncbi:MAG TPA: TlpA disulfide reductase family protein [Turneriella sp.]|nr:TlpA disulfide reductase family protein [Turneriella sp.]HNE20909.1 TlpA disulfide reductase family protein [Turneriella sp.]HNL55835.1 TlpA disulfide reductase family protein [Turneriella sp.]